MKNLKYLIIVLMLIVVGCSESDHQSLHSNIVDEFNRLSVEKEVQIQSVNESNKRLILLNYSNRRDLSKEIQHIERVLLKLDSLVDSTLQQPSNQMASIKQLASEINTLIKVVEVRGNRIDTVDLENYKKEESPKEHIGYLQRRIVHSSLLRVNELLMKLLQNTNSFHFDSLLPDANLENGIVAEGDTLRGNLRMIAVSSSIQAAYKVDNVMLEKKNDGGYFEIPLEKKEGLKEGDVIPQTLKGEIIIQHPITGKDTSFYHEIHYYIRGVDKSK